MQELMQSTSRIRRGWLDRLRSYKRVFETEITDGEHTAYGRGHLPRLRRRQRSAFGMPNLGSNPRTNSAISSTHPLSFRLQGSCGRIFAYPPPCGNSSHSLAVSSRAIRAQSVTSTFISRSLFRFAIAIARLAD